MSVITTPKPLSPEQMRICQETMGSYAFFHVVADALMTKRVLSLVRVSDGEKRALDYAGPIVQNNGDPSAPLLCCDEGFRKKFGVEGITVGRIWGRIHVAANTCTHFAPTLSFWNPPYDLTPYFPFEGGDRPQFVDEMFQYHWNLKQKRTIMALARRIVVINRDPAIIARVGTLAPSNTKVMGVHLDNWTESDWAMKSTLEHEPDLVLMSAALGSKYIGPSIAKRGGCVVLDIGQAADCWDRDLK